jgi:hypothetical protein
MKINKRHQQLILILHLITTMIAFMRMKSFLNNIQTKTNK